MLSIVVALGGYVCLAVVNILDKFIVSDRAVSPRDFVILSSAPGIFALALFLFGWAVPPIGVWLVAGLAALGFFFGLYTMYRGVAESEISHLGPLIGAVTPLMVLFLGPLFLSERISGPMFLGMGFLILGTFSISFEQSSRHQGWHRGLLWGVAAGISFGVFQVLAKITYNRAGFGAGLALIAGLLGAVGLLSWIFKRRRSGPKPRSSRPVGSLWLVVFDKMLGLGGMVLIQYASSLGSVMVVNALAGLQYALLVILVVSLTKFFPGWFREVFRPGELAREAASVGIIFIGLLLVVLTV